MNNVVVPAPAAGVKHDIANTGLVDLVFIAVTSPTVDGVEA